MSASVELLQALGRAYALAGRHPPGDAVLSEALEDVREAQGRAGWTVIRVGEPGFLLNGFAFPPEQGSGDVKAFHAALREAGIGEFRMQEPVEPEVLETFLRRLAERPPTGQPSPRARRFLDLAGELGLSFQGYRGPLPGMPGSIQALFGPVPEPAWDPLPAGAVPEGGIRSPAESPAPGAEGDPGGGGLGESRGKGPPAELVAALLAAGPQDRPQARRVVEGEAERLREAQDWEGLAELVLELALAGGEEGEAAALARRWSGPEVASRLVGRLAQERDPEIRARWIAALPILGREVAETLAEALGEASDRFRRRVFLEALAAMGSAAAEVAGRLVEDSRWFVVRNALFLLGELGGEHAVAQVTGTLAHPDPRVRKEAVLALGKLGGDDAVLLLLGMLEDPAPEVRAMACRALGALKAEKALKPILRLLEEDDGVEVRVECLRALGCLGDPGAVPAVEKRGLGGLFSRPPREVRVAAYRALAAIGTPRALELVERATRDPDPAVRTVAQALLSARKP